MLKTITNSFLLIAMISSFSLNAQDTTEVVWDAALQPGQLEAAITGPGVYRLTAGAKYLTSERITVETGAVHIVSAVPVNNGKPAAIQPLANAEGALGHEGGFLFSVTGADAELALKGLVLNAMAAGLEGNLNLLNATSTHQKVIIDDCVVSHTANVAIWAVGTSTDFHITNSIIKSSTGYPGGMFFGGVLWGGGFWMGTIDTLVFQYNTVEGQIGEAFALYEHLDHAIIDHNTFSNIIMDVVWYRGQNNLQFTNNLLHNTKSYGQSTNDVTGWGVWWGGGAGQFALRKAGLVNPTGITSITAATYDTTYADDCGMILTELTAADTVMGAEGTYVMVDGQVVDMFNRNINWNNNAAVWSPALSHFMDTMSETPWSWDVSSVSAPTYDITPATYDTTYSTDCTEMTVTELTAADTVVVDAGGETLVVTTHDTMMTAAEQLVWADDSTLATINSGVGVTSTMNAVLSAPDLGMLLQEEYIRHQILRTLDFRDDQSTNGVGATYEWMYEHDGNYNDIEWPLHMDFRYSDASTAATHSTTGGPIGDPRWVPHAMGNMSADNASLPKSFELKQNYPNPFNPSTDIVFNLEQSSNITLTIFNVLGQKVKVLADESKLAGTYSLSWDGRDDMGALVSTGLYFYTLTDGSKSVTKKMALMK
jgi:hypothetical protein